MAILADTPPPLQGVPPGILRGVDLGLEKAGPLQDHGRDRHRVGKLLIQHLLDHRDRLHLRLAGESVLFSGMNSRWTGNYVNLRKYKKY